MNHRCRSVSPLPPIGCTSCAPDCRIRPISFRTVQSIPRSPTVVPRLTFLASTERRRRKEEEGGERRIKGSTSKLPRTAIKAIAGFKCKMSANCERCSAQVTSSTILIQPTMSKIWSNDDQTTIKWRSNDDHTTIKRRSNNDRHIAKRSKSTTNNNTSSSSSYLQIKSMFGSTAFQFRFQVQQNAIKTQSTDPFHKCMVW
mgnify:CR=1 FL=1